MKVNREQFLAAALLFAATAGTTGCGKITDKMKESIGAAPDPAVQQPVQGAGQREVIATWSSSGRGTLPSGNPRGTPRRSASETSTATIFAALRKAGALG